jgi:hypothetical protein
MIGMRLAVRILGKSLWIEYPVGRIQKLCSFEDHLYDMLVAMILRGLARNRVKIEDVHGTVLELLLKPHSF